MKHKKMIIAIRDTFQVHASFLSYRTRIKNHYQNKNRISEVGERVGTSKKQLSDFLFYTSCRNVCIDIVCIDPFIFGFEEFYYTGCKKLMMDFYLPL